MSRLCLRMSAKGRKNLQCVAIWPIVLDFWAVSGQFLFPASKLVAYLPKQESWQNRRCFAFPVSPTEVSPRCFHDHHLCLHRNRGTFSWQVSNRANRRHLVFARLHLQVALQTRPLNRRTRDVNGMLWRSWTEWFLSPKKALHSQKDKYMNKIFRLEVGLARVW